ncbi:MAG: hypothetical protein CM15mP10_2510 [Actinomycetota bacterium]|nr:MAG: hypothetical protein CM15mP10_2510 [Actinomycetota bacterium]
MANDCCGLNDPVDAPAWYVEGQAIVFQVYLCEITLMNFKL